MADRLLNIAEPTRPSVAASGNDLQSVADARLIAERYALLVTNLPASAVMMFDHDLRFVLADGPELERNGMSKHLLEGQREVARAVRTGAWVGFDRVRFRGNEDVVTRIGGDVALDTRVDPMLSQNAVYVRAAVERLGVRGQDAPLRTLLDANVYLPGPGASIVAVRAYRDGSNRPVPAYLQVLRGRDSTLRGFRAGEVAGDSTAAGSLEWRLPLTNPLEVGKIGVRAFIDAAAVYDAGADLRRQHFERGVGGGVWFTATVIRFAVDVAHGSGGATRVQVSSGLSF